ncbi:acyl-CoA dehydrogenase family protein [Parahaliea mediterranea]|uniref:Acyl-CoA/acyl-ACP dehydrogenase n=1 Tax=Parahaliea mediterranea TaxID=651086 RepID=A0A939DEZ9_9GAMM|nr:acyl-CoA dehydrogenase family protein [Parahaliea mediterranea]MBN7796903.1 acyl-CoA/acyl-ACP dehydrogenase [Parahaliea mediterranea]
MKHLVPSDEHIMLQDSARQFLQANCPVSAFRHLRDNSVSPCYSRQHWKQICDLGWSGIILPEEYGGLDFGYVGLGAIMKESGRTLLASPLFASVCLGAQYLLRAGSDTQKRDILPSVVCGDTCLALAIEEGPHHDPLATLFTAQPDGGNFVLNGTKTFVVDGQCANYFLVVARTSGKPGDAKGLSVFLVDIDRKGVERKQLHLLDARDYSSVDFDNVIVGEDDLVGSMNDAWRYLEPTLDAARILLAAEMLGGICECFERTVEYLRDREQFGVKIGSFQALRHRAAHLFAEIELCKAVVDTGLAALDGAPGSISVLASLAKARLNDIALLATNEAVQMHGGIGVTDELDIGLFLKRARVAIQILGDSSYHRDRFGRLNGY